MTRISSAGWLASYTNLPQLALTFPIYLRSSWRRFYRWFSFEPQLPEQKQEHVCKETTIPTFDKLHYRYYLSKGPFAD